jgi:hypothetical protein
MRSHEIAVMTGRGVRAVIAAVIVAVVAVMVTACNGNGVTGPDPATCKAALQAQYVKAQAGKAHFTTNLPSCKGLPEAEVQQLAQQVKQGR